MRKVSARKLEEEELAKVREETIRRRIYRKKVPAVKIRLPALEMELLDYLSMLINVPVSDAHSEVIRVLVREEFKRRVPKSVMHLAITGMLRKALDESEKTEAKQRKGKAK